MIPALLKPEVKRKTLFWLERRRKQIKKDCEPPSQEEMAERGMAHGVRLQLINNKMKAWEDVQSEVEALKTAIDFIEEHG